MVVHRNASEEEFRKSAPDILTTVSARADEIDLELLWESAETSGRACTLPELTGQYFAEVSPELQSAMFRALEKDTLLFKRKGTEFEPRPAEQVASERRRIERARENETFRNRVADMIRRALAGDEPLDEPDWVGMTDRLERWLRQREKDEVGTIFEQITGTHQAREAAYDLLVRLGRIENSEDRFLLIRGFPTAFRTDALDAAQQLDSTLDKEDRTDWTAHRTIAIDDESTVEVDDALTVLGGDNRTLVGIHIADVAAFTVKGDALDREAARRTATLYLPNVSVPMFPERLSTDLSSLVPGAPRPAFTIATRFDSADTLESFEISRSVIEVSERMTYEAADEALSAGEPAMTRLHAIAERLHATRTESGAQTHKRPEIKVRVRGGDIQIHRVNVETPSRLIVSEMMILANRIAADHATVQNIPIIYRTQESPEQQPPDTTGLPEAIRFELLRKSFKRSRLSLSPAPHAGLGVRAYTQMSSPIRRYADLVTQRQFAAAMRGEPFPYDTDELFRIITSAEATEVEIRHLEQSSTTYWVLTYLSREKSSQPLTATVLDHRGTVELNDYLVRGKAPASEEWPVGDVVNVEIESVRPIAGEVRFKVCM